MRLSKILLAASIAIILAILIIAAPAAPVQGAQGIITLSNTIGQGGMAVGISGTGFTPGSIYTVNFGINSVLSGNITAGGALSNISFAVPQLPRGTYNVTVTTFAGDTSNFVPFTITPVITGSPSSGFVGDTLSMSGSGFGAGTTVNIYFDGISVGSATSSTNGAFSGASATVPQTYRGNHSIYGNDGFGASSTFTYSVSPRMTITPRTGSVGTQVAASGTGFGASLPISFYLDDALTSIPATNTSSLGSFTSNFTIPPTSYGSHTLKAQDSGGGSATSTFTASQTMTINPQTGNSGSSVTIYGSGFGANKNINITYDGANVVPSPATVIADASGNFNITMTVPPSGGGTHSIAASDGTISATANFTIVATSNITASKGTVDSSVSLSGSGFFARGTVTIRWDNAQVAQVTADAGGVFSASIKVPPSKTGDHAITVTDGTTSKTFTFTVTASASLKESAGYVGGDISMSGSGFGAGAAITITYDGNKMATAAADASGSFTAVFKAPVSKGGSHIIAATDGTSTINTTFTMDATPPPVPPLLQPPDKTQADSQPNFVWTEVSDPSGVTYTFQLATDSNFNTIVLARNLTNPGFKLTEKENLPSRSAQEPYYWRVKAVDDASNESDWSPAYQFFVGFIMPAWGLYVIFGFVTLLIGLGAFWLGRRTSYRWDW